MPSFDRIVAALPTLYRPEGPAPDLYTSLIVSIGDLLDEISSANSEVMQAHWFGFADSALLSGYELRFRQIEAAPPLKPGDPEVDAFPYLAALPRIGTLFDQLPWAEPLANRERVEDFRTRITRLVALYRNGLGTLAALRTMTLLSLPIAQRDAPEGLRERPFTVEEFSPTRIAVHAVRGRGQPTDLVGPLMRWEIDAGRFGMPVTAIIAGVTPVPEEIDATSNPVLERFDPQTGTGVGLAYAGTIAPDQALALVPVFDSWLGTATGLQHARHAPTGFEEVNPTASGPWAGAAGPSASVVAQAQASDQHLWLAVSNAGVGELWRTDGVTFTAMLTGLPEIRCICADGASLLVGFTTGVARLPLYAEGTLAFATDPSTATGAPVNAMARDAQGSVWLATDVGAARLRADDSVAFIGLGARAESRTSLSCVFIDGDATVFFGGELGAFRYRPDTDAWSFYGGQFANEGDPDWLAYDPATQALPAPELVFLPPVRCITRGSDAALWFGTDRGIARYLAREHRRAFTTMLEAYPHVTQQSVRQVVMDERGRNWFATATGLIVFDGQDWSQNVDGSLLRLAREASSLPDTEDHPLRIWRFHRDTGAWQSLTPGDTGGFRAENPPALARAQPAVLSIAWTDGVQARLGTFDGESFTVDAAAGVGPVRVRFKPDALRIMDGGIAAIPRLQPGLNHYRYLALEDAAAAVPDSTPAWTREGRLLPEPQAREAPWEGRYLSAAGIEDLDRVFAFNPSARVWMQSRPRELLSVTVRLARIAGESNIDAAILDRVFTALNHVRPAGVRVALAEEELIVRGN